MPFPNSYALAKKKHDDELEKEMLDLFSKLEVNVPMLVLVKQMPDDSPYLVVFRKYFIVFGESLIK